MANPTRSGTVFPGARGTVARNALLAQRLTPHNSQQKQAVDGSWEHDSKVPVTCNQFPVPTRIALDHSLCLIQKPVWDIYEGIEYITNQGADDSNTVLSRRIHSRSEALDSLYIVKKAVPQDNHSIKTILKPMHNNIVTLYQVFNNDGSLYFIYEEMDVSLEQVFLLDVDPWSINPEHRDSQIASIIKQVIIGLLYLHETLHIAHGELTAPNILLNRKGVVKIANVGKSILASSSMLDRDQADLQNLFLTLQFPLDLHPNHAELEGQASTFWSVLRPRHDTLDHSYLEAAEPGQLVKLVVRTIRVSYNPPRPFQKIMKSGEAAEPDTWV